MDKSKRRVGGVAAYQGLGTVVNTVVVTGPNLAQQLSYTQPNGTVDSHGAVPKGVTSTAHTAPLLCRGHSA